MRAIPIVFAALGALVSRTGTLVAITLISALATPVVVNATTPKVNTVVIAAAVAAPTCTKMIRVVYAGYGEGQGAPCSVLVR
jgi:hypothetical protein